MVFNSLLFFPNLIKFETLRRVLGDRIGGLVNVTVEVGDLKIPGISGAVFFYCKVNGTESPILEADVKTYGVVQFVKGFDLDDFELSFNAFKVMDDDGGENWLFAGSVSATMAFGDTHGASIDFVFDTRDNTWGVAVGYEMTSPNVNVTLKAGISTFCKPEGQFLRGAVSVKIGDEGYLYGSARGAKHCGDYRRTKGVINLRAAVDEAKIKTEGMLMYLENVELKVKGITRDELITAEGFMEAQAELPVSVENPYFTPEPGYGRRKLLDTNEDAIDPRVTMNYRTNCFNQDTYNQDNPNEVFKSMNNESWSPNKEISWLPSSSATITSLDCLRDIGYGETSDICAVGKAIENNANHPVCPDDDSLMSGFMFMRDNQPGCKCDRCVYTRNCFQKRCTNIEWSSYRNNGNKFAISYNCLKQPSYAAPFGECRDEREEQLPIKKGGNDPTDLKVLEHFLVQCGAGEAFKSFQTTTNKNNQAVMGWKSMCCKLPSDAGPLVKRVGTCFYTALPEERWYNEEESIMLTHLMGDKGVACGPGEVLTAWQLESCEDVRDVGDDAAFMSRFVWTCRHVGGIHSPPPPAPPPPAPPVDDSIDNLDWIGNFSGNAKIAFGEDLDNAMMEKTLGIIKINASFSIMGGEFKLDKLLLSAAVSYIVPAKMGSWQAEQGLNELEITGFAKLNYPVRGSRKSNVYVHSARGAFFANTLEVYPLLAFPFSLYKHRLNFKRASNQHQYSTGEWSNVVFLTCVIDLTLF